MRFGLQDPEMEELATRAEEAAFRVGAYRVSVCGLCAGSGIAVMRDPQKTEDPCRSCLGVGKVWRLLEGQTERLFNAREVLAKVSGKS